MVNEALASYITAHRTLGTSDAEIRQQLLAAGWAETEVEVALSNTMSDLQAAAETPVAVSVSQADSVTVSPLAAGPGRQIIF